MVSAYWSTTQFLKHKCLFAHTTKNIFPNESPKQESHYKIPLNENTWYIMEYSGNSRTFKNILAVTLSSYSDSRNFDPYGKC